MHGSHCSGILESETIFEKCNGQACKDRSRPEKSCRLKIAGQTLASSKMEASRSVDLGPIFRPRNIGVLGGWLERMTITQTIMHYRTTRIIVIILLRCS